MPAQPLSNDLIRKIFEENGCFSLVYRRDRHLDRGGKRIYFYFRPHFAITMREDKKDLIQQLKESLGFGKVSTSNKQVRLDVFSPLEARKIVSLLDRHPFENFREHKQFELWREAVEVINRNLTKKINVERGKRGFISTWASFDQNDLKRLFRIREEMRQYKKWRKSDYKWTHSLMARPF